MQDFHKIIEFLIYDIVYEYKLYKLIKLRLNISEIFFRNNILTTNKLTKIIY